jgi:hypothetical protein
MAARAARAPENTCVEAAGPTAWVRQANTTHKLQRIGLAYRPFVMPHGHDGCDKEGLVPYLRGTDDPQGFDHRLPEAWGKL